MMKKILCALMALTILLAAALPVSASGAKYERMLLLGDSITYGYGLEGDVNTCKSYGNLVRDELGLDQAHFKNAAVNGYTSAQLLALLPQLASDIAQSDLIIVTIGGNDLLHVVWDALDAVLEGGFRDFTQIAEILADAAKMQKLIEQLSLAKITSAIAKYTTNMAAITSYLRTNAPDAEIIFLAQYDPMEGVEGIEALSTVASAAINMLNAAMKSQVELSGCTYLDVYTPFRGHAKEWTNIMAIDIHPNSEGHRQLSLLVMEYLNSKSSGDTPAETTPAVTTPAETTPAVTTPAETTPAVTTPTEPTTAETTPAATTPAETTPAETTTAAPAPAETTPAETTPTAAEPSDATAPSTTQFGAKDPEGCGAAVPIAVLAAALPLAMLMLRKKKK